MNMILTRMADLIGARHCTEVTTVDFDLDQFWILYACIGVVPPQIVTA